MTSAFTTLGFGLLLGIKHAFEPDHLIAVSTILAEQNNTKRAALVGTFWGLGHTVTLLVVGIMVIFFRLTVPDYIAQKLEMLVGLMLIILGIMSILNNDALPHHEHEHLHGKLKHSHLHNNHSHRHGRSFLIGAIHGLAGSGAIMILVIPLIHSVWEGAAYILIFGIGSTLSMTIMSLIIGVPFVKSTRVYSQTSTYLRYLTGAISIIFGIFVFFSFL